MEQSDEMEEMTELTRRQNQVLTALLTEPTLGDAAEVSGVSKRTIQNYLSTPEFLSELRHRQNIIVNLVTANLVASMTEAVGVLRRIMHDVEATLATQSRAADSLLRHAKEMLELGELSERLVALEVQLRIGGKL